MITWLAGTVQGILALGLGWALAQWLDNRVFRNNVIRYTPTEQPPAVKDDKHAQA